MTDGIARKAAPDDIGTIANDIRHTREALGDTVSALAAKVDVKERIKQKASDVKVLAGQSVERLRRNPLPFVVAAAALAVAVILIVRGRR